MEPRSRNQSHSSPTFEVAKDLQKTPVSEVDVEYRHAQQAGGWGPQFQIAANAFAGTYQEG